MCDAHHLLRKSHGDRHRHHKINGWRTRRALAIANQYWSRKCPSNMSGGSETSLMSVAFFHFLPRPTTTYRLLTTTADDKRCLGRSETLMFCREHRLENKLGAWMLPSGLRSAFDLELPILECHPLSYRYLINIVMNLGYKLQLTEFIFSQGNET